MAQTVKNLLTMQETWVPSLGQEDPLEKGMATHSSILVWRIPWTAEPGRLQSMGLLELEQIPNIKNSQSQIKSTYFFKLNTIHFMMYLNLIVFHFT